MGLLLNRVIEMAKDLFKGHRCLIFNCKLFAL